MVTPETAIVVPCYNEERRLDANEFRKFLFCNRDCFLLFVDDGSKDRTLDVLHALEDVFPENIGILSLPQNCGKAEAVRQGLLAALKYRPKFVGYWDADLATPLNEIPRFCETFKHLDRVSIVLGSRMRLVGHKVSRQIVRRMLGKAFAFAASTVLSIRIRDTQCGAKMLRVTDTTSRLFQTPFLSTWIFDVEILARMKHFEGFDRHGVFELPVAEWNEIAGSKLKPFDFIRAAKELYWIHQRYRGEMKGWDSKPSTEEAAALEIPQKATSRRAA
ncbi:MAG: glycosyltransferase [Planctomycetota bacterium]